MKRLLIVLCALLWVMDAPAQSPGVGLDSLPAANPLGGGELLFAYQAGSGGGGATICLRGWCPVHITPAQLAAYMQTGGVLTIPIVNGGTGANSATAAMQNLLPTYIANDCLSNNGTALAWATCGSGSTPAFSAITSGTNTTAAMIVGSGGSISYSGSGTVNANEIIGYTFPALVASNCVAANSGGTALIFTTCGGSAAFSAITSGDNTAATMTVDTGASLSPVNGGFITATSFASAPGQCASGQFATGINAYGSANCSTPSGSGNVSTSGTITSNSIPQWATGTTLSGTVTVAANSFLGAPSSGSFADLTVSQAIGVLGSQTANAQTGSTYTFALTDANNTVTMNNGSSNTVCIPPNSSVAFPVGTLITVQELGAGVTTIAPAGTDSCAGSGVTTQSPIYGSSATQTYSLGGAYGLIQFQQVATNTWNEIIWNALGASSSGTVNSGTSGQIAYYASTGNAVSGASTTTLTLPKYTGSFTSGDCVEVSSGSPVTVEDSGSACGGGGGSAIQMESLGCASVSEDTTDYCAPTLGLVTTTAGGGLIPVGGTFENFYVHTADSPASGQTFTFTFYLGTAGSPSSTTITCQITSSSNVCSDTTHTVTATAGEQWDIQNATSATSGATGTISYGIQYNPS